jgi:hypothetical protein
MKKVFMIHGFAGEPNGGWRPWLMGELFKYNNTYACALPMPSPSNPIKEEWVQTILQAVENPGEEIFLVGHSLGVPTILRYLEKLPEGSKIGGVVLVSAIRNNIPGERYELVNKFLEGSFDFDHIKNVCENFVIIHGEDDLIVPISDAEELSSQLSCKLIRIPNGKHLNEHSGFYQLPEALDSLIKMIK